MQMQTSGQPSIRPTAASSSSLPDQGVVSTAGSISVIGGNGTAKSWADEARDLRAADHSTSLSGINLLSVFVEKL